MNRTHPEPQTTGAPQERADSPVPDEDGNERPADAQENGPAQTAGDEKNGPAPKDHDERAALRKKVGEYEDDLKRLAAEFDNYKKRVEKEKLAARLQGKVDALAPFLDMEEAFEQALVHSGAGDRENEDSADRPDAPKDRSIREGLALLHKKLRAIFAANGVKDIRCEGLPHHAYHEVVLQTDGSPAGHIAQTLRKGYEMEGHVLRPAQVAVFSGKKKDAEKESREKENE